jgi:hypothetical protein
MIRGENHSILQLSFGGPFIRFVQSFVRIDITSESFEAFLVLGFNRLVRRVKYRRLKGLRPVSLNGRRP